MAFLGRPGHVLPRLALLAVSLYITLVAFDVAIVALTFTRANPQLGLQGLYSPDDEVGFRLTPLWRGVHDDGIVEATYEINTLGHRDDEPVAASSTLRRIVLIGDSFTFGALLDQSETIDKQIEAVSGHAVDAYNLGTPGYGPPGILQSLKRYHGQADDVFYLFFNNDLRDDNLLPDHGVTVVSGFMIDNRDDDGHRVSAPVLETRLREYLGDAQRAPSHPTIGSMLRLYRVRRTVWRRLSRSRAAGDDLLSGDSSAFRARNVSEAVSLTLDMKRVSEERGAAFHVVIIPTRAEAGAGEYSGPTTAYVHELRSRLIDMVELLPSLSRRDYFEHDGHFNPRGARLAAEHIVDVVGR